jgi:hypothetical protein
VEKIMASRQARNLAQEAVSDLFFVTWMHKIVNIPADTKLLSPSICAMIMETAVPAAVLIVRYPILNFISCTPIHVQPFSSDEYPCRLQINLCKASTRCHGKSRPIEKEDDLRSSSS